MIVLFGGAAGAGKTTVAHLWCQSRARSVHLQLDAIRNLIVSGLADPQVPTPEQSTQYSHSVSACAALARSFDGAGYDIAIDDVFEPEPTHRLWIPQLAGLDARLITLHPPLETALSRAHARHKRVLEHHIRSQHAAVAGWPPSHRLDSGTLTPVQTLERVVAMLDSAILT